MCAYSSAERIDADGNYVKPEYSFPVYTREKMLLTSIAHHFRLFRRQAWARTTGFREDLLNAVDYDMFLKLSELGPFHHVEEVLYQRRWHGGNTSLVNEEMQTRNTMVVQKFEPAPPGPGPLVGAVALDPTQPAQGELSPQEAHHAYLLLARLHDEQPVPEVVVQPLARAGRRVLRRATTFSARSCRWR